MSPFPPAVLGTAYCIASALCYTGSNICLRQLAGAGADEMWVICIKELVTVAVIGPWLLWRASQHVRVMPPLRATGILILAGLAVQLAGNLSVQWAFGIVGIAITVPVIFGVMLTASAVMGLTFLGERVPARSVAAISVLIGSIVFLSLGAGQTSESGATSGLQTDLSWALLGVGAASIGGLTYAGLSTVIRSAMTARVPVTTVVFIITGTGAFTLGVLSLWHLGPKTLMQTDFHQMTWMLGAGAFNLVAFLSITKGLQLTTVVHANLLNASQVAMAGLAGIWLFNEAANVWLALGIGLTVAGVLLIGTSNGKVEEPASHNAA